MRAQSLPDGAVLVVSCGEAYHVPRNTPQKTIISTPPNVHHVGSATARYIHNPDHRRQTRVHVYPHPILRRLMPQAIFTGKVFTVGATLGDFFDTVTKRLKLVRAARRAFLSNGREVRVCVQDASVIIIAITSMTSPHIRCCCVCAPPVYWNVSVSCNGWQVFEAADLQHGAVILVSCGEAFRPREMSEDEQVPSPCVPLHLNLT